MKHVYSLIAVVILSAVPGRAADLNLLFDNQSGYGDDDIWIMFQQGSALTSFNITDGSGTAITRTNGGGDLTASQQLSANNNNTNGFTLGLNTSLVGYIGIRDGQTPFGTTAAPSFIAPADPSYHYKWQPFELSRTGNAGDNGDISAINFFGLPLGITSYNGGTGGTQLQSVGFGSTTAAQAYSTLGNLTNNASSAVIKNSAGTETVRVIGPSSYSAANNAGNFSIGAYQSFETYLAQVHASQSVSPGNPTPTTTSLAGVLNGTNYTATVTVNADLSITISNVTFDGNLVTGEIVIPADTVASKEGSYALYAGVQTTNTTVTGVLASDADLIAQLIGDTSAGFSAGMVDSRVTDPNTSEEFRDDTSEQWFAIDQTLVYDDVQSSDTNYNRFGAGISDLSGKSVYGFPFSDRFNGLPVTVNSTDFEGDTVDTWVITIGDSQPIPEPGTGALLLSMGAATYLFRRRR